MTMNLKKGKIKLNQGKNESQDVYDVQCDDQK